MNQWILNLDKYQRDNLLVLLRAISGYQKFKSQRVSIEPFHIMNTGDWVLQLQDQLEIKASDEEVHPLKELDEVQDQINNWLTNKAETWSNE